MLGRETRYQNLERQLNRLDDRIRAHETHASMHAHDGPRRLEPQGFQANDQPKSFMGGGGR